MILPADIELPDNKFLNYLFNFQKSGDKSAFLMQGGYTKENWHVLKDDLYEASVGKDAPLQKNNVNGEYYELDVELIAPNNKKLLITTIWLNDNVRGKVCFITLIPRRRKT